MPGYPEAFEYAKREAKDQWHAILKDRVDNGLEELYTFTESPAGVGPARRTVLD